MIGLLAIDIITKQVIQAYLGGIEGNYVTVIPGVGDKGFFALSLHYNTGAFGGILGDSIAGRIILVTISGVATIIMCFLFYKYFKKMNKGMMIGVLLAIPGTFGNFIDRFLMLCGVQNGVIDFLWFDLGFKPFHPWNIFNVADAYLVIGIFSFVIAMIIQDVKTSKKENKVLEEKAQKSLEQDYLDALNARRNASKNTSEDEEKENINE
jgi:lipoprotein signal peptidase